MGMQAARQHGLAPPRRAMRHQHRFAQPVEPSYIEAFATSIAVRRATCVWNSNRYCSVPCAISGW